MSTNNDKDTQAAIEAQRAKAAFHFVEDVAPGLRIEMELHKILHSSRSPYQKIDVIETYFGKTLVTDGKTQSAQFDEFAYHESLVHPALFKSMTTLSASEANDYVPDVPPTTVFIGGGGELATVREVLRHKSIRRVVMVDLDAQVIDVCKRYLPEWGGEEVANDRRLELVVGDALLYLDNTEEKFDVIIMDISDPIEAGPGILLYTKEFYQHALTRLNMPHGVFVTQAGTADSIPPPHASNFDHVQDTSCYGPIHNTLKSVFDCVVPYSTNIPSFGGDWGFCLAFQASDGNNKEQLARLEQQWRTPPVEFIDQLVEEQITGGSEALGLYDGTSHMAMFALTKPLRKALKNDSRIMTRANPIFMY